MGKNIYRRSAKGKPDNIGGKIGAARIGKGEKWSKASGKSKEILATIEQPGIKLFMVVPWS